MRDHQRPVGLWVQAALGQAAWQGARLIMSYQTLAITGDAFFLGLQSSAFALAGLLIALPTGRIADRFGSAVVRSAGLFIALAGTAIALLFPVPVGLLTAAILLGAGHIGLLVGQQCFAARLTAAGKSDTAFGALTAAASMGQLFGPPLVTTFAAVSASTTHPNTTLGLLVCLGFLVLAIRSVLTMNGREKKMAPVKGTATGKASIPVHAVMRVPGMWQSLVVSGAVLVSVDLLASFLPLWAVERGVPATVVGLLLASRAVFTVSSRFGMSRLLDVFGRQKVLTAAIGVAVIALGALPLANQWWAFPLMCLIGVGLGLPQPLTMAWVVSLAPKRARGAALGLRMTSNRLAQVSIPLAVGAVAGPAGVGAVFWSTAAFLAGAAALSMAARHKDEEPPTD
ncbi:MFS transporter [Paenarthrobacter sp. NPDC089989]|uniref:MFS transporter n=1 Tax=unclassified Paenarthrobacter TaxID=2634190 RepID=UPI00380DE50C